MMIKAENSSKFRRKISKKPSKFAAEQSSANGGSPTSPHRGGGVLADSPLALPDMIGTPFHSYRQSVRTRFKISCDKWWQQ